MISPLHLDHFWVEELIVKSTPPGPGGSHPKKEQYLFREVDFDVEHHSEKNLFRVRLVVEIEADPDANTPPPLSQFRIVILGIFSFSEGTDQEFIDKITPLNQVAILYGIARGLAASIPIMERTGALLLPSVNFLEVLRMKTEENSLTQDESSQPATPSD